MPNRTPETKTAAEDNNAKKLIRSKYKDVLVKADEDIYHLDRLKLALNSNYFEKLLLSPDWKDENAGPITIPLDSDAFHAVVDVIYGSDWPAVLTVDNYVSVWKTKDFLEIKTDHNGFAHFISHHLESTPTSDVRIFEFLKFIAENDELENSLRKIYAYFAKNLEHFQDDEKFLSLPIDHFVKIISYNKSDEKYTYLPYYEDRSLVVEVCCKWICHDLENRLPLMIEVSNAALEGLVYMRKGNDTSVTVELSDIDERTKHQVVLRYFQRLLNYGTVLDSGVAERPEDYIRKRINFTASLEYRSDQQVSETEKLKQYVKNGDLYDITVKVHQKIYKLHRSILESKSGYFEKLFSTEYSEAIAQYNGIPSLPDKDKEYVIEGIDEATFDFIVDYIYCGVRPADDECIRVFKAAYILKIPELLNDCRACVEYGIDEFDSIGCIPDILDFTHGKDEYIGMYVKYLERHIRNSWPDTRFKAAFYSISWDCLEKWLLSSGFYFDDAEKVLDMCSAWIMHDVKSRYHLIPQVALAIKRYGLPDTEDYKLETPTELGSVTEKSIRDTLWGILSSLSLIPTSERAISSEVRKFEEWPVFVTSFSGGVLDVLNANFDRLATMSFRKMYMEPFRGPCYPMSATIVEDNLFISVTIGRHGFLLAYHVPSKKFIELRTDFRIKKDDALLNRRNELYCGGAKGGSLLRYSHELNRWSRFSKPESDMDGVRFTSDGDKIFRLYRVPGTENDPTPGHNVEWFDFEKNQWISLPSLPSPLTSKCRSDDEPDKIVDFTVINAANPAVLLDELVLWYDMNSRKWRPLKLPDGQCRSSFEHSVIAQGENEIVQVFNNKLYCYSNSNKSWELRKEVRIPTKFMYGNAPYFNIVVVNRPTVSIQ